MSKGWTYWKKGMIGILAVVLAVTFVPARIACAASAEETAEDGTGQETENQVVPEGSIVVESKNNKVPTYKAGEQKKWTFTVRNISEQKVTGVKVAPELGDTSKVWPFKTDYQDYSTKVGTLEPQEEKDITFTFTQRDDVKTTRYTLQFGIYADDMEKDTQKFYVNTTAKKKDSDKPSNGTKPSNTEEPSGEPGQGDGADIEGGISNGEAEYSGGGGEESGTVSVPRVIVTGFSTSPSAVRAGKDFELVVHLKNTSKSSAVRNMLFDLNAPTEGEDEQTMAPAFLPTSGSSAVYLDGIEANGTADISIKLNAKADLLQKPYSIDIAMKYEDMSGEQIDASSSLSIPVKQDARFEFSQFEINPQSVTVGDEANVMASLYNLGRIKLYNVKAVFEGACIETEEVFLGNVESGATASIDAMLTGSKATEGPAKITMTLSYEDESGKVSEKKEELELEVMEMSEDEEVIMPEMEEESAGIPKLPFIILGIIVVAAVVAVIIVKKTKKKKMENEEEALLDELDGPSEDERE